MQGPKLKRQRRSSSFQGAAAVVVHDLRQARCHAACTDGCCYLRSDSLSLSSSLCRAPRKAAMPSPLSLASLSTAGTSRRYLTLLLQHRRCSGGSPSSVVTRPSSDSPVC